MMRVAGALTALLFAVTIFAGCVDDEPEVPGHTAGAAEAAGPEWATSDDGRSYLPNLWIPETQVPVQATTVRAGAEPMIQVRSDNSAIWIGHVYGGDFSTDGGATWKRMTDIFVTQTFFLDGWDFAEDADGWMYAVTTDGPEIHVMRSQTNGVNWDLLTAFTPDAFGGVADRPWIDARGSGHLVLIFNQSGFTTECLYSRDGGLTWLEHAPLRGSPISGNVVFGPTGAAYWATDAGVVYRANPTAVPAMCVNGYGSVGLAPPGGVGRTLQVTVDHEEPVSYVAWPSSDNSGTYVSALNWTTFERKHFLFNPPALASSTFHNVQVKDGRVYVAFYATETAGNWWQASFSGAWDTYLAVVDGFWTATPSVSYHKITSTPNHIGSICITGTNCDLNAASPDRDLLDYFGMDVGPDGKVHIAYVHDGATSDPQVVYAGLVP